MLAEHLPPGSHALRGGGWGGQELQAPAQLKPPRAKASRAARAPAGSTARCIQPGQQWPQRSGTAPCPSSLGRWSGSSRSDRSAHCPQMVAQGLSQTIPASVGAFSPGVGELRRPDQSQDFLSPQKTNHHPCLRLSNSQMGVWCALSHWKQRPSSRVQQTTVGGVGGTTGLAWCLGEPGQGSGQLQAREARQARSFCWRRELEAGTLQDRDTQNVRSESE